MFSTDAWIEYLETPEKSANDRKNYKCMVLSNGLKVVLVSDNKSGFSFSEDHTSLNVPCKESAGEKLSAVSLMVDVGSFTQPREFQGLAHFLEHMIFMGSKKYPKENSFDTHITKYGGYNNACTDNEETMYYFEVPEKHLESSMKYFAEQLKAPLLLQESMTREREVVESEYQSIVNNDYVRRSHVLKSLANESYPHVNFTWGNLKSLKEDVQNEEDLRRNLVSFYKTHYSAHRMFTCIQSCLPMQELEELAIKYFADISSNHMPGLDFSQYNYQEAFKDEFFEEFFLVKPIGNVCQLNITWVLPSNLKLYKCKPANFLSYLLGYEGKGSLCAYLRKRLWALQVMAGPDTNQMFTLFNLSITLTELGLRNLDDVLKATFSYIKVFNKASKLRELYEEEAFIKSKNFEYCAEISPGDYVQYLAKCCKYYPPQNILTAPQLYFCYSEIEVQNLLDHLNVFRFNITLTSQQWSEDVVFDRKEKWFGTEYTSKKIPDKWLEMWNNCSIMTELHLPQANPFIAQDFKICWLEDERKELVDVPTMLMQTERFELWFKQDDKFHLPHAFMYFHFISPLLRKNSRNIVICGLYVDLVEHHLVEELYPATVAGICYEIYCGEKGVVLTVDGYNEKLHIVVELLIKGLISIKDRIDETQLETYKKQYQKNYFNELIDPEALNVDLQNHLLKHKHWLLTEKMKFISNISLKELQLFMEAFTEELYAQVLIQGNLKQQAAEAIMSTVMDLLDSGYIKQKSTIEDRATKLPLGTYNILCHNLNPKDCNSVITNFYQVGPRSLRNENILNLLVMILKTPLYDTLRTKQQLGYSVNCFLQINCGIIGYAIRVSFQATKHSNTHVEQSIEAFRASITTILNDLSLDDFQNFKNALIKLKEINDLALHEDVHRNWSEITSQEYLFKRRYKEIEILKTLEKQDILEFWLKNEAENLRKLSIQVIGYQATTEEPIEINEDHVIDTLQLQFIDFHKDGSSIINVAEFKDNLEIYPVTKTEV